MKSTPWCLAGFIGLFFMTTPAFSQQQLPLFPKYQVLGVVYDPPGSSSSVTYSNSTQVGSSHSITSDSSSTTTQTETDTSGFSLFGFGYSETTTTSDSWMSSYESTTSESLQTTTSNSVETQGPISSALGVYHDQDIIYIWLNPVYKTTLNPPTNGGTVFPIAWSGFMFNGCDLNATQYPVNFVQLIDGCDPYNFPSPDILGIPVFCLKNPYFNPATNPCSQYLPHTSRFWDVSGWGVDSVTKVPLGPGLDIQDYADILQADPLVTQTLVANNTQTGENAYTNPCHPTYGINFDPNSEETIPNSSSFSAPYVGKWPLNYCGTPGAIMDRFTYNSTVEYPAPNSNGQAQTITGSISNTASTTQSSQSTDTHTHSFNESESLTFAASASYGPIGGGSGSPGWTVSNLSAGFNFGTTSGSGYSWTDGQTIGNTATKSQTDSAAYSITGPTAANDWNGPVTYNVYQDAVYGTFAFRDPNRSVSTELITAGKSSPIGVAFSGNTNFGTVQVGKHSSAITVTLTNNSPNVMTMLSPVLSFSDLAVNPENTTEYVSSFEIVSGSDGCSNKVLKSAGTCTVKIEFAPSLNAAPNAEQSSYPVAAYLIAGGNETVPVTDSGETTYDELVLVTNTVITVSGGTETAVTLSGTATPGTTTEGATLTPTTLNFPAGATSGTQVYTFKNYASTSQTVSSIQLSDTSDYSITSDDCSGKTVSSLATCAFTLVYSAKGAGPDLDTKVSVLQTVDGASTTLAFAGAAATLLPIPAPGVSCTLSVAVGTLQYLEYCATGEIINNTLYTLTLSTATGTNGFGLELYGACLSPIAPGGTCQPYASVAWTGQCQLTATTSCQFTGSVSVTGSYATPSGTVDSSGTTEAFAEANGCQYTGVNGNCPEQP
jgi:hypothetical protein